MNKNSQLKLRAGILALSTLTLSGIFITPIIAQIAQAFPTAHPSMVGQIISTNILMNLIGAWIFAIIQRFISEKTIALFSIVGIVCSGVAPYFLHSSIELLIVFSGIMGIFLGFIATLLPTLISHNYAPEDRQAILGQQVAFSSIGAMIMVFVVGQLGTINWYTAYLAYAAALIILAVCVYALPSQSAQRADKHSDAPKVSVVDIISAKSVTLIVVGVLFSICVTAYNNTISLAIAEAQLGDSNYAGIITMVNQIGGLLAGLLLGHIIKVVKNYMYASAFVCLALGMLLIGTLPMTWSLLLGSFLAGMSLSFYYAQAPFLMSVVQKPWAIPMGIAALTTATAIGGFLSPLVVNGVVALTGRPHASASFIVCAVIAAIIAVSLAATNFQGACVQVVQGEHDQH